MGSSPTVCFLFSIILFFFFLFNRDWIKQYTLFYYESHESIRMSLFVTYNVIPILFLVLLSFVFIGFDNQRSFTLKKQNCYVSVVISEESFRARIA